MEVKDIIYPEFKGLYKVHSNGQVWSVKNNRFLKQAIKPKPYNYTMLVLSNKGYHKAYNVHKVIAEHFLIKPVNNGKLDINHKDLNKQNNDISNLEYITHSQNILHARQSKKWSCGRHPGYSASEETKIKMSLRKQKKCIIYNDNQSITFDSISLLCDYLKCDRKSFNRYVNSHKTYKNYYIRYIV